MLLKNHLKYTVTCLDSLNIRDDMREQICIGNRANDLCELTSESKYFITIPPAPRVTAKNALWGEALIQSHFGRLASLHAMAKLNNEPAANTRAELETWFEYLNELTLKAKTTKEAKQIARNNKRMREMFGDCRIDFEDIADTDDIEKLKFRGIGMMLHLIQDSYTVSHCKRDGAGKLEKFYYYEAQVSRDHEENDDVADIHKSVMLDECTTCINSVRSGLPYNYTALLTLSSNASNSDGGRFAKQHA